MSIWLEIELKGGVIRAPLGNSAGRAKSMSAGKMLIEISKDGTWTLVPPLNPEWRYYIPDWAGGTWKKGIADHFYLYAKDGSECFLLRQYSESDGPAFYGLGSNGFYAVKTTWRRAAKPFREGKSGCWSGIAVKGAAGVAAGAETVPCAVRSWDNPSKGASFNVLSGRLGLFGGFSGGVALVIVTGFPDINELNGFSVSGWDWTLSIGAKAKGFDKLGKTGPLFAKMVEGISSWEGVIKKMKDEKHAAEVIGIGKNAMQTWGFDFEEPSVSIFDIPLLGGGGEAGIYIYAGTCKLLSQW